MDIVYTQDGTVAAIVVGKTTDGSPVVVELGKATVLSPLPTPDGHNAAVHGYSYDLSGAPSPGILNTTTIPDAPAAPAVAATPGPFDVLDVPVDEPTPEPVVASSPSTSQNDAPTDTADTSSEQRIEAMLGSFLGELGKVLAPKPAARRAPAKRSTAKRSTARRK
jgi:hypothetical protein